MPRPRVARYARFPSAHAGWAIEVSFTGSPPSPGDRVQVPGRRSGVMTERVLGGLLKLGKRRAWFDAVPLSTGAAEPLSGKAAAAPAVRFAPDTSAMGRHYAAMAARRGGSPAV